MAVAIRPAQALKLLHDFSYALVRDGEPDFSPRQLSILLTIYMESPPHTVRGLAKKLGVTKPVITRALDIALRTIFSLQRRRVRRAGARAPRTGAVTFVQKFGGALNLNVHFHCVIPDGVFVRDGEGTRFLALSGPSDAEVQEVLGRIVRRLRKLVRPRSRWRRPMPASPTPSLPRKPIP